MFNFDKFVFRKKMLGRQMYLELFYAEYFFGTLNLLPRFITFVIVNQNETNYATSFVIHCTLYCVRRNNFFKCPAYGKSILLKKKKYITTNSVSLHTGVSRIIFSQILKIDCKGSNNITIRYLSSAFQYASFDMSHDYILKIMS